MTVGAGRPITRSHLLPPPRHELLRLHASLAAPAFRPPAHELPLTPPDYAAANQYSQYLGTGTPSWAVWECLVIHENGLCMSACFNETFTRLQNILGFYFVFFSNTWCAIQHLQLDNWTLDIHLGLTTHFILTITLYILTKVTTPLTMFFLLVKSLTVC